MVINKRTRMTPQRTLILKYIRSVHSHPTAEMVYRGVIKEMPTITLATVYRNLNLLAEQGDILKLEINNEFRFDGDTSHHQHCVCRKCNRLDDLFQEELSEHAMKNVQSKDFHPEQVSIIFTGLCNNCK